MSAQVRLLSERQLAARPALRNGHAEQRDPRFAELDSAVRKPVRSAGIEPSQEIAFAVGSAVQVARETMREIVTPLLKQIEELKRDLTALENGQAVQRRQIAPLTVEAYWEMRPCFICSETASRWRVAPGEVELEAHQVRRYGPCEHRELDVALAEIERTRR